MAWASARVKYRQIVRSKAMLEVVELIEELRSQIIIPDYSPVCLAGLCG